MKYEVENIQDLDTALKNCRNGDVITGDRIETPYNLWTVNKDIVFEDIIFSGMRPKDRSLAENISLFDIRGGARVRFDKVRFYSKIHTAPTYNSCHIKTTNAKELYIDGCQFSDAVTMSVWTFDCDFAWITDCNFQMRLPIRYGYGIWQGGSGSAKNQKLSVSSSSFEGCRHSVAGHYGKNHIHVDRCDFYGSTKHIIDRHSGQHDQTAPQFGIGGGDYIITNNRFHDPERRAIKVPIPHEGCTVQIHGNVFGREQGKCVTIEENVDGELVSWNGDQVDHPQIFISDNFYKG